jgi:hypothetical protein
MEKQLNRLFEYFNIGLPLQPPPTPMTGLPSVEEDYEFANMLIRKEVDRRGFVIMTTDEKQGREIHDIIPIKGHEGDYSNEGSAYFPFHVEVPQYSLDDRPDYIMLFCVRSNPNAKTLAINFKAMYDMMDEDKKLLFSQPLFKAKYGVSFSMDEYFTTNILHNNGDITCDLAEMIGVNREGEEALEYLKLFISENYEKIVYEFNLKQGDFLLLDNKKCIHARNSFSDTVLYDGSQRWLKRVYLKFIK